MNTIKFRARLLAKALVFTMAMLTTLSLGSCRRDSPLLEVDSVLRVINVAPAKLHAAAFDEKDRSVVQACQAWSLNKAQVEGFFRLSKEYQENPYSLFYQVPCSISGELAVDGRIWKFEINGGATAEWSTQGIKRYWGCSVPECEPLVMAPTDLMNPENIE